MNAGKKMRVRDVWRQQDLGRFKDGFEQKAFGRMA